MNASIIQSSSWVMKNILALRNVVQQHQQVRDNMLGQHKFNMSAMYEVLAHSNQNVEWRRLLKRSAARPRAKFITWLTCHRKLAIKDKLKRFNMIDSSTYSLCHTDEESISHLFFTCRETVNIWKQVLMWMNIDHQPKLWYDEIMWALQYVSRKGWRASLMKIALAGVIYGIWHRRNMVVFGHTTQFDTVQNIIDNKVYRGWLYRRTRSHIA
ncbi:uncharacterized protein LOC131619324 [Vicia villosa]|uniref:uncharacterized protein LOC131619324 n=1 Tax=Vicia villosa TaxID=3911 RepID=UPI00273B0B7B|nr:uncharacterized protein LOC131619324 [Vicia villosa]